MTTTRLAKGRPTTPRPLFRSYYLVGEIDYQYSDFEVVQAISELLGHGANELTVRRIIVDDNMNQHDDEEIEEVEEEAEDPEDEEELQQDEEDAAI
jgi:hypothetical protein